TPPGLKPGLSANVTIFIDRLRQVLAVPLGSIYAAGTDNYVFLRTNDGEPKPLKVDIGQVNDTHAQIAKGLSRGDQVLILEAGQGRELLEKAGIKVAPPPATTQPLDAKPPRLPQQAPAAAPGAAPADNGQPRGPGGKSRGPRNKDAGSASGNVSSSSGERSSRSKPSD